MSTPPVSEVLYAYYLAARYPDAGIEAPELNAQDPEHIDLMVARALGAHDRVHDYREFATDLMVARRVVDALPARTEFDEWQRRVVKPKAGPGAEVAQ